MATEAFDHLGIRLLRLVNLLLDSFRHRRRSGLPALMISVQVAASDVQGAAIHLIP